jgi:hypothetical protein
MTSGGTESILTAVKASRDYMRAKRGIREPEMIIANSAHAAFFKAAEFFKIRLIKVLNNATLTQTLPSLCPAHKSTRVTRFLRSRSGEATSNFSYALYRLSLDPTVLRP